jgi:release factor glutamine methyltransferase
VSVRALLADAVARLGAAGVASPRVDAELLLAHCAGVRRARLITHLDVDDDGIDHAINVLTGILKHG